MMGGAQRALHELGGRARRRHQPRREFIKGVARAARALQALEQLDEAPNARVRRVKRQERLGRALDDRRRREARAEQRLIGSA